MKGGIASATMVPVSKLPLDVSMLPGVKPPDVLVRAESKCECERSIECGFCNTDVESANPDLGSLRELERPSPFERSAKGPGKLCRDAIDECPTCLSGPPAESAERLPTDLFCGNDRNDVGRRDLADSGPASSTLSSEEVLERGGNESTDVERRLADESKALLLSHAPR